MHEESLEPWLRDHAFGQDRPKSGERRTWVVIAITLATMVVEIAAGLAFGSMALLADGLHMGSHASALGIAAFAYFYTRRHARDPRFSFGTGKVNTLGAFASAVLLVIFALAMAAESLHRFIHPVEIQYGLALWVAVVGLVVNACCLVVLHGGGSGHGHDHGHEHGHDHDSGGAHEHEMHHDHGLWSAYLHVAADALTSVLAIAALLAARAWGWVWMDPLMGIVGAAMVVHWSMGLLGSSARVLLDMQAPAKVVDAVKHAIEANGDDRVVDLHVWAVGPGIHAAEIVLVSKNPQDPDRYGDRLPHALGVVHATVEVHRRSLADGNDAPAPVPAQSPGSPA